MEEGEICATDTESIRENVTGGSREDATGDGFEKDTGESLPSGPSLESNLPLQKNNDPVTELTTEFRSTVNVLPGDAHSPPSSAVNSAAPFPRSFSSSSDSLPSDKFIKIVDAEPEEHPVQRAGGNTEVPFNAISFSQQNNKPNARLYTAEQLRSALEGAEKANRANLDLLQLEITTLTERADTVTQQRDKIQGVLQEYEQTMARMIDESKRLQSALLTAQEDRANAEAQIDSVTKAFMELKMRYDELKTYQEAVRKVVCWCARASRLCVRARVCVRVE